MRRFLFFSPTFALAIGFLQAPPPPSSSPRGAATRDPEGVIVLAERAIQDGRPFRATELLDSLLKRREARSPRLLLVAARAAAGWGGWSRVRQLLADAPWLDSLDGAGHALLAQEALARGDVRAAEAHAAVAVRLANEETRGTRLVLLARSLDQVALSDSAAQVALREAAATTYLRAAAALPAIRDWLTLRAAAVTDDSTQRAELLSSITLPAARGQRRRANASAAERAGDWEDAARLYRVLGAPMRAMAVQLEHTESESERAGIRSDLLRVLRPGSKTNDTRAAIDLLDLHFAPLSSEEELVVARRAAMSGPVARAAAGFQIAATAGLFTGEDRFTYGSVLVRLGRNRDAINQFAKVSTSRRRGEAAYQAARSRMRMGEVTAAMADLRSVTRSHASDPAAGTALYLLGDLHTDRGQHSAARGAFLQLGRRYPGHRFAATGRLRAALLAYQAGNANTAAAELDALRAINTAERGAATYWAGRAWQMAGDTIAARVRWAAAANMRDEYYALLAIRALEREGGGWRPPRQVEDRPPLTWLTEAVARVDLLDALDLAPEATHEHAWMRRRVEASPVSMVEAARVLDSAGRHSLAVRYAIRAQGRGAASDRTLVRLLYPLPFPDVLEPESQSRGLDPLVVASIIRQESAFDPRARSRADARGLMQVLPSLGRQLATGVGITGWNPVLLYQPEVNVRIGTVHFARTLRQYSHLVHALAAYNAGGSRVRRWLQTPGADDPEWFVERIPIRETRDYVRRILVNLARYQAIYPDD